MSNFYQNQLKKERVHQSGHLWNKKLKKNNNTVLKLKKQILHSALCPLVQTKFPLKSMDVILLLFNKLM